MPRKRKSSRTRRYALTFLGTAYLAVLVAVGAGAGSWQTPAAAPADATRIAAR